MTIIVDYKQDIYYHNYKLVKLNQMNTHLKQLFTTNHIFNLSAIERKAGLRKLKLHEFVNGKAELSERECLKINKIVENAIKLQK
jgi:hypothetical protein